jgi:hypothetical protein
LSGAEKNLASQPSEQNHTKKTEDVRNRGAVTQILEFDDAVVLRPDVQDMIGRSLFYRDPEFDNVGTHGQTLQSTLLESSIIKIHMKDGRRIRSQPFSKRQPTKSDEL